MLKEELRVKDFLKYIKMNSNIKKLGTNSDNKTKAIHRWFSFLPGYSHLFVETTLEYFKNSSGSKIYRIFDPFMGSATTAVAGRNLGIDVIGNESNQFLYKIGKAKTHIVSGSNSLDEIKRKVLELAREKWKKQETTKENKLLIKCYSKNNFKKLVTLRNIYLSKKIPNKYKPYFLVAISSLLPRCSNVGISIPYVSWNHKHAAAEPFQTLSEILDNIKEDIVSVAEIVKKGNVTLYLHDSRIKNERIKNNSIDLIFTSPPYLNNFDYGEAFKVYTYFWKLTDDWHEITEKVRKKSLTSATTHYKENEYNSKSATEILGEEMVSELPRISSEISKKVDLIKVAKSKKNRKKSFNILTALYFKDMFYVLNEMKRVLKNNGLCFIVIGDSAPYGVYIPTDDFLGQMAAELGFSEYFLETLRERGYKWLNLTHRHKIRLRESLLILRK